VVYNKAAIAGPIGLRTYFNFEEKNEDLITFVYERFNLSAKMLVSKANEFLANLDCFESLKPMEFLQRIRQSKEFVLKFIDFESDERTLDGKEEMALCSTLYIFNRILRSEGIKSIEKGFTIKIDSDMSIGAGVGSSASYGVCLAGEIKFYFKRIFI
jgi:mevalonate kinase